MSDEIYIHKFATAMPVAIRDAQEGDVPFIFNSWLQSFRKGSFSKFVDNKIYFSEQHKLVERLLRRSTVKMAVDPNEPATIYGYTVYETIEGLLTVHYCYTKHTFRAMGVQRQLLKNIEHDYSTAALYSHNTIIGARIAPRYNLVYHPYILLNYYVKES